MVKRRRNKVSMPSSGAGLVRYMDEDGRGVKLRPEHITIAAGAVVIFKIAISSF